ncbi:hypothetical protein STCU_02929 [Strigomonas culicis]|uniref:Uncharacterized protein n=1 Tax=Strigomonas culicis TaxID=28005 RepID=S9UMY3_9TRYP|nr:hypothetical protein STCU_02929 [Strigomonas culicis]|eukprot:EPY32202.1 hypothetical protein STCU_02929 [Strigomonas culicis]
MCRVLAYSTVELKDPPRLNSLLTFADWFPVEVLLERRGVVLHLSMAANEGGMHMRNVRAYELPSAAAGAGDGGAAVSDYVWGTTDDAAWLRQHLCYDGPCLWHLEMDLQNELYDTMQDHGVDLDFMRWAAEWVSYLEHVCYTRWCLGVLDVVLPEGPGRGPEEDFLTAGERAALDEPVEDWLAARTY